MFTPKEGPSPGQYTEFKRSKSSLVDYGNGKMAGHEIELLSNKIYSCGEHKKPTFNH